MKKDQYKLVFEWLDSDNKPFSHPELNIIAANEIMAAIQLGERLGFLKAELTLPDKLEAFTGYWKLEKTNHAKRIGRRKTSNSSRRN